MLNIFHMLIDSVIPVAFIFLIGFFLGKRGVFAGTDSNALFKFIANISAPAIIFSIVITTDLGNLDATLVGLYLISELLIYGLGYFICRWGFNLDFKNALLCGLAASFGNHVLFVYPITMFAFPPEMSLPVRGIIAMDTVILTITVVILDIRSNPALGAIRAIGEQLKNPLLLSLILGIVVFLTPLRSHIALVRSADFIANAAAPCGLFASGILLAQPILLKNVKVAALITSLKMILHPLLGFFLIMTIGEYSVDSARTTLMVTAAPVGIMALTFASRYGGETQAIAQSILWSFCLSVLIIPLFAMP